ncbi:MAG: type II secretion system protein [Coxiellaceae bacterium]|nr:MAG: type II secretion system protein [Coxiellaceae bacterium]
MLKTNPLLQRGFTLIEVLLVMIIISALAVFSINYYRDRTLDAKAMKPCNNINNGCKRPIRIIKNHCWPGSTQCSAGAQSSLADYTSRYVPVGSDYNAWKGKFTTKIPAATITNFSITANEAKFAVTSDKIPASLQNRILAKLPSSTVSCDNNICSITSEINVPIESTEMFLLKAVGVFSQVQDGKTVTVPPFTCPTGWGGSVGVALGSIRMDNSGDNTRACTEVGSKVIDSITPSPSCSCNSNICNCKIKLESNARVNKGGFTSSCTSYSNQNPGKIDLNYIAYCYNPICIDCRNPF